MPQLWLHENLYLATGFDFGNWTDLKMPQVIGKSEIVRALSELPEDATLDDAFQRLFILHKIEQGLKEAGEGKTMSQAEVESEFRKKRRSSSL